MNYPLLITGLAIIAAAGLVTFKGHIRWFKALPSESRADVVLILVIVAVLAAWGLT